MDYQFKHDLLGNPLALCDLEYEALGDWLTSDLATDKRQAKVLIEVVEQLLNYQLNHHQHNGKIYHLTFEQDEGELFLNHNEISHPEFIDHNDSSQPICGFGLTDFKHLLEEWVDFIK
jgi:uncharacterized protein YacL (UPF0231 family)